MPGARTDRATVTAWAFWDWGSAAFNAVLVTFIFSVYLTDVVGADLPGRITASSWYGAGIALAGVIIALVAPVMGQRADLRGTRKRSLGLWTAVTVALMACLVAVSSDHYGWFWLGVALMAVASVTFEFAEVNYFAMLGQVSTPANVGRVSGFGWSMGYFGGIVLLLVCYFGFISGDGGMLGLSTQSGWNVRAVALLAAVWFAVSAIPLFFRVPEIPPRDGSARRESLAHSYRTLWRTLRRLWYEDRNALRFLLASAVFRDGLAGVFTFGAILAVSVYGLSADDVLLFGVAANVVSALGAVAGGRLDDAVGPKPVIAGSLWLMVVVSVVLFFGSGTALFWVFGLLLCLFVGPAQSSSRSLLSRIAGEDTQGEMFGLYATAGRAVSWMAPAMWAVFTAVGGSDRPGILGVCLVLVAGAVLLMRVKTPEAPAGAAAA